MPGGRLAGGMAEAEDADFVCPFCGRAMDGQTELTDHFETKHDMAGFADT